MKIGYLLSVAIIPFMVLGTSSFDQGNKDKGQKGNKGGKQESERVEKQKDQNNDRYEDRNDDRQNNADGKNNNDDRYDDQKGDKQKDKGKDRDWKEDDKWEDGRWDDDRFDSRMKKIKDKKNKSSNDNTYNDVRWYENDVDYYKNKGPKGNKKVDICHKPNGNDNSVGIRVSENAVKAHMKHGDYVGVCKDFDRSRFSDNYWSTRDNYYNQYNQTTETLSFGEQLLAVAINKLTNARSTMVPLRSTLQEDELRRKEAALINLQNDVYSLQNSLDRSNEQVGLQVNVKF